MLALVHVSMLSFFCKFKMTLISYVSSLPGRKELILVMSYVEVKMNLRISLDREKTLTPHHTGF